MSLQWSILCAMKALLLVSCLLVLCSCRSAHATQYYVTASKMADDCRVAVRVLNSRGQAGMPDSGSTALCVGYVTGVLDGFLSFQSWRPSKVNQICLPEAVEAGQAVKMVMKYIDAHPEELHLPAPDIVWAAMHDAFPCAGQ